MSEKATSQPPQTRCKCCAHPGIKEIDVMILNDVVYTTIIAHMQRLFPNAPVLNPANINRHKTNHLLNQPITKEVVSEDGTKTLQTYLTGHYDAPAISIPPEAIPQAPSIHESLRVIIAAGIHNILLNPRLVTPDKLIKALELQHQIGGGENPLDDYMTGWEGVTDKKETIRKQVKEIKRTRQLTLTETTTEKQPNAAPALLPASGQTIEGEWQVEDMDSIVFPSAPIGDDEDTEDEESI